MFIWTCLLQSTFTGEHYSCRGQFIHLHTPSSFRTPLFSLIHLEKKWGRGRMVKEGIKSLKMRLSGVFVEILYIIVPRIYWTCLLVPIALFESEIHLFFYSHYFYRSISYLIVSEFRGLFKIRKVLNSTRLHIL